MSILEAQVHYLRSLAADQTPEALYEVFDALNEAADTIESLSAKLQAANMERSAEDCGRWIPCKERLPEETGFYMVTKKIKETCKHFPGQSRFDIEKGWNDPLNFVDIVAWQPLPEPYQPKGE